MNSVDWTALLSAAVGLLGGGGVSWLFFLRSSRRKSGAEATTAEASAKAAQLEYDSKMLEQNKVLLERNTELVKENSSLRERLDALSTAERVACQNVCIHTTCPVRKPLRGLYEHSMAMDDIEYMDILAEFFAVRPFTLEDLRHRISIIKKGDEADAAEDVQGQ